MRRLSILCVAVASLTGCGAGDDALYVAVASNFTEPARAIAGRFSEGRGDEVLLSFGSTAQLFTQISQAAPFEVFLSADRETPRRLIDEGLGVEESVFTYAVGEIVLYSRVLDLADGDAVLRGGAFEKLAIASPTRAPYGRAAHEALEALGLATALQGKLVEGNNVAQAFQFVESRAAELGFVARSQVAGGSGGSVWRVPESLYSPIRQDAVLLTRARDDSLAREFLAFLTSSEAVEVLAAYGYRTGP